MSAGKLSMPSMSREQATELYKDLQKALLALQARKKAKPAPRPVAQTVEAESSVSGSGDSDSGDLGTLRALRARFARPDRGHQAAAALIVVCAAFHVALSAGEYFGVFSVAPAEAAMARLNPAALVAQGPSYSKEELTVLKSLDKRRSDLEDRQRDIDARERDFERRDREAAVRLTELRELASSLKTDREKNDRRQREQLTQLANVYVSMSPNEAAQLMEQLDLPIALSLIRNMPEKRIGQILALMSSERALEITKTLSGQRASAQ